MNRFLGPGLFLLSLGLFSGCARKRKNIFSFPTAQEKAAVLSPLSLPTITDLELRHDAGLVQLSWRPVEVNGLPDTVQLVGYNLYRFFDDSFISATPLNNEPLTGCSVVQNVPTKPTYYAVRAVFSCDGALKEGPLSHTVIASHAK